MTPSMNLAEQILLAQEIKGAMCCDSGLSDDAIMDRALRLAKLVLGLHAMLATGCPLPYQWEMKKNG